jgi:hypothetical protein
VPGERETVAFTKLRIEFEDFCRTRGRPTSLWRVVTSAHTPSADETFIASVQDLIAEVGTAPISYELSERLSGALVEGYARVLALEGARRRLHARELEIAECSPLDSAALSELTELAQREARIVRQERVLRALLESLRSREQAGHEQNLSE